MVDSTIYRSFAAPSSKLPSRRVNVYCKSCGQHLAKYAKGNGAKSSLVKMYRGRIVDNLFDVGEGGEVEAGEGAEGGGVEVGSSISCPSCSAVFGREAVVKGRRAIKVMKMKITVK
jgi:hypothetical protein